MMRDFARGGTGLHGALNGSGGGFGNYATVSPAWGAAGAVNDGAGRSSQTHSNPNGDMATGAGREWGSRGITPNDVGRRGPGGYNTPPPPKPKP